MNECKEFKGLEKNFNYDFANEIIKKDKVTIEDAVEFKQLSKTYSKVLAHRKKCKKWGKEFCIECFGGGLTQFTRDLEKERIRSTI